VLEDSDPAAAERALQEAKERSPEDWRIWLEEIRLQSRLGHRAQALRALKRTRALAPPTPELDRLLRVSSRK
jgi:Flp pilus assembly protein TadD